MKEIASMRNLWQGVKRLSRKQQLLVGALLLIVALTWLAVCVLVVSLLV